MSSYRTYFRDKGFASDNGPWTAPGFHSRKSDDYTKLRAAEGRLLNDEEVVLLPGNTGLHQTEWRLREKSFQRLLRHLRSQSPRTIVEVGCGNGWLIHGVASALPQADCCGLDIHGLELMQATRVFGNRANLTFALGDLFSDHFLDLRADVVILASAAQYFENFEQLFARLNHWIHPTGSIHILDSPFYDDQGSKEAAVRTADYLKKFDSQLQYHHRRWSELNGLEYEVLYQPHGLLGSLRRMVTPDVPFPWIIIKSKA